jgi:hypothetical protein
MTFTEKHLRAVGTVAVGGRQVKRYHISIEPGIEEAIQKAAAEFLPRSRSCTGAPGAPRT